MVTEALSRDFPGNPTAPSNAVVVFDGPIAGSPARTAALTSYVDRLGQVAGVRGARVTGVHGDVARVDMGYAPGPNSPPAEAIVG